MTKPPFPGPQNLLGTPGLGGRTSQSYYEVVQHTRPVAPLPPARPATPPPPAPPTLTLRYDERGPICELSKALLRQLPHLKHPGRVLLVVPAQRGGEWYLDTKPKPGAGAQLPLAERAQLRLHPISKLHFMHPRPEGSFGRAAANQNVFNPMLRLCLGTEVEGHAGYYRLVAQDAESAPVADTSHWLYKVKQLAEQGDPEAVAYLAKKREADRERAKRSREEQARRSARNR